MKMNILVTLDEGYLGPLTIMLRSLVDNHRTTKTGGDRGEAWDIDVYVMNSALNEAQLEKVRRGVEDYCGAEDTKRMKLIDVKVDPEMLKNAPITERYPQEMYYRIFAARFLPKDLERVLYLDPDMVIINSLEELYTMDFENHWFCAASHVGRVLEKINEIRLQSEEPGPYINSGVMLMNLSALRESQDERQVFGYIEKNRDVLILPDQDVISALYGGKIKEIDHYRYNMTERAFTAEQINPIPGAVDEKWVMRNTCVVHYLGRNKPWKEHYRGKLDFFYQWYARK